MIVGFFYVEADVKKISAIAQLRNYDIGTLKANSKTLFQIFFVSYDETRIFWLSAATIVAIKMKNDLDLPKSYGGLEGHVSE